MSSYGYQVFSFRLHHNRQPEESLILGELLHPPQSEAGRAAGPTNDALGVIAGVLRGAENKKIDKRQQHLTITKVKGEGRSIRFTAEVGTSGQESTFKDSTGRTKYQRGRGDIETLYNRALIVAPARSRAGLLVLEAQGRTTGRQQIESLLNTHIRNHTGLGLKIGAVVEGEALSQYLDRAKIHKVTLKKHSLPPDVADLVDVPETEREYGGLEMNITPGRMRRFARSVADKVRGENPTRSGLLEMHDLHFDELLVRMDDGDRKVTLTVSSDMSAPTFTYHLSGQRPSDDAFYADVVATVPRAATGPGVIVGEGWQSGVWAERLAQFVLTVPGTEVSNDDSPAEGT